MAAVWAAGPEPMMATLVWDGWGFMVGWVVEEVKERRWALLVGEEGEDEKDEVVALAVRFCCEAVEAARVRGRPERRGVGSLRRKLEENSLKVGIESVLKWSSGRPEVVCDLEGYVSLEGAMNCKMTDR